MRVIGIISVRQLETGVGTILILTSVALNIVFRAAYFDHVVALTMGAEYFLIAGHQVTPKIGRALDLSIMQNLCLAHYRISEEYFDDNDLIAQVERLSDKKRFEISLSWLSVKDEKSKDFLLLEDFATWVVN